jgi:BBSome-interacting protein 1
MASAPDASASADPPVSKVLIQEVLPKAGLVYSEKGNLSEVLCKPKIMPIKSKSLERLEGMEAAAAKAASMPATAMQAPSVVQNL